MTHEIKSRPLAFHHRWEGVKPWEIRLNDRKYRPGDYLHEREWDAEHGYSGRSILSYVPCVYDHKVWPMIPAKHVIMTVVTIARGEKKP